MNRVINYETPEFAVVRFDVDKRIMNGVDFSGNEGDGETVEFDTTRPRLGLLERSLET